MVFTTKKAGIEYSAAYYNTDFFGFPSNGTDIRVSYLIPFKKSGLKYKPNWSRNMIQISGTKVYFDSTSNSSIEFKGIKIGIDHFNMNTEFGYNGMNNNKGISNDPVKDPFSKTIVENANAFGISAGMYIDEFITTNIKRQGIFGKKDKTKNMILRFGIEGIAYPQIQRDRELKDVNVTQQKNNFGAGARFHTTIIMGKKLGYYTKLEMGYHPFWGGYVNVACGINLNSIKK